MTIVFNGLKFDAESLPTKFWCLFNCLFHTRYILHALTSFYSKNLVFKLVLILKNKGWNFCWTLSIHVMHQNRQKRIVPASVLYGIYCMLNNSFITPFSSFHIGFSKQIMHWSILHKGLSMFIPFNSQILLMFKF